MINNLWWRHRRHEQKAGCDRNYCKEMLPFSGLHDYQQHKQRQMKEPALDSQRSDDKVEISVHLDSELFAQLKHLTNDPSKVIEVAIRQWLKGSGTQRDDDLTRTLTRTPVPPRGEWND